MNTANDPKNDAATDAPAKRTLGRDLRFAARSLTWYDLACLGLMITSIVSITVGLFG